MVLELLQWGGIFIAALAVLIKSADYFTEGAEGIGLYYGLSSFIVGATIVALGSSLPEIATSILSVINDQTSFPIDNIIGSNIANCLLVGGVAAIAVKTLKVEHKLIDVDLPFFFISTSLFLLLIMDEKFTFNEIFIATLLLFIFIAYTIFNSDGEVKSKKKKIKFEKKWLGFIVAGVAGIYFGAEYTIKSVTELARILEINPSVVTMLAVAIGTSLPELIVSTKATLAGKHSVALGNIFGSNTINALAVTGIPAFFGTLTVSNDAVKIGIPFLIVASLAFIFTTSDDKIQNWEGYALLVIYVAFVGKISGFI
jgi:cation:H+ antiporter